MSKEVSCYYTLQLHRTDGLHKAGEVIANRLNLLHIGQTEACEVRLPNHSPYEDVVMAVIKPNEGVPGWRLIKVCQHCCVMVNGMPIDRVCYLKEGDRITFEGVGQELSFHVRYDENYDDRLGAQWKDGGASWWRKTMALAMLSLLVSGACMFFWWESRREATSIQRMRAEAKGSVYEVRVDSILWLCVASGDTMVLDTYSLSGENASRIVGTAFLTTDSLLVTARHCIEPWLNNKDVLSSVITEEYYFKPVYWALVSETYNQCHDGDTLYMLSSVCSVRKGDVRNGRFSRLASTDFHVNREYDEIIELGDFDSSFFWRNIARRGQRTDMMRADVAYIKMPQGGSCKIANRHQMHTQLREGTRLDFIGYPMSTDVKQEHTHGELKHSYHGTDDGNTYFEMLEHNGELSQGYSGAPVIMCSKSDWYVVGVVSVTDAINDGKVYSVPITEVK